MILLNPGPVTLSARVRSALAGPDLCHREPEFADLQDAIRQRLLGVYDLDPEKWAAVVLTGSGTAAVEAMVASLVPENGKLLSIENGVYGERITRIAQIHGIEHARHSLAWGAEIDLAALARALVAERPTHVAVVQHETTTGRLNDLEQIASLCAQHGAQLLLDGVSSFGAEGIDFDAGDIVGCAATANKCLHGTPGAAFVIVRRAALAKSIVRSLYLDLAAYCAAQDVRSTPFTPSIPSFYALAEALAEHAEAGGWQARHAKYQQLSNLVGTGLAALGIQSLLPTTASSVVLRGYYLPANLTYAQLHDGLKREGFVIYAGQGDFAKTIFRVSTMGAINTEDMQAFVRVVKGLVNG